MSRCPYGGVDIFGYHDDDRCVFDLWSPVDDPNGCAVENRAFSPYAKHTQEVEDIIDALVHADAGNYTIDVDDDLSQSDLDYIKFEVMRRRQEEDNGNN